MLLQTYWLDNGMAYRFNYQYFVCGRDSWQSKKWRKIFLGYGVQKKGYSTFGVKCLEHYNKKLQPSRVFSPPVVALFFHICNLLSTNTQYWVTVQQ